MVEFDTSTTSPCAAERDLNSRHAAVEDSEEISYDYGNVMASSRSEGINFWGALWGACTCTAKFCYHGRLQPCIPDKQYACNADLPGFTRSVYATDHALVTPESRVFAAMPGW